MRKIALALLLAAVVAVGVALGVGSNAVAQHCGCSADVGNCSVPCSSCCSPDPCWCNEPDPTHADR